MAKLIISGSYLSTKIEVTKKLAEKLGADDFYLDEEASKTLAENKQEVQPASSAYNSMETLILAQILSGDNLILSAGEKTFVNQYLKSDGQSTFGGAQQTILINSDETFLINLVLDQPLIKSKLKINKDFLDNKPAYTETKNGFEEYLEEKIKKVVELQDKFSAIADLSIEVKNKNSDELVAEIMKLMEITSG